jgi:tetratricopeptide (TPR) repeat protein
LKGQGHLGESRIKQALDVADPTPRRLLTASHHTCGNYLLFQGRFSESVPWFEKGLELAILTEDSLFQGFTLGQLGHARAELGQFDEAWRNAENSLAHFIAHGDENWIGAGYTMLCLVANRMGEPKLAITNGELGLAMYAQAGYPWGQASALNELAMAHHLAGSFGESKRCQEESIAIKRQSRASNSLALSLSDYAATLHAIGETQAATDALKESLELLSSFGDVKRLSRLYGTAAELFLLRGDEEHATLALATMHSLAKDRPLNICERMVDDAVRPHLRLDAVPNLRIEALVKAILTL